MLSSRIKARKKALIIDGKRAKKNSGSNNKYIRLVSKNTGTSAKHSNTLDDEHSTKPQNPKKYANDNHFQDNNFDNTSKVLQGENNIYLGGSDN